MRLRIASAYGVWYERPNAGRSAEVTCPVDTSIAAAPACANACATRTVSSSVWPSSTQSVAEIRTVIGRSAGHTARIAANTSSGQRSRPSTSPPYASVRRFVTGDRKPDKQVAVRAVQLQQVESGLRAPAGTVDELVADLVELVDASARAAPG